MKQVKNQLKQIKKIIMQENPNIFFLHIPKTGGTSIDHAISQHYQNNLYKVSGPSSYKAAKFLYGEDCNVLKLREYLALHEMRKGTKYIAGHVPFNSGIWNDFKDEYIYLTLLRHPVKRYISDFFFNSFKKADYHKIDCDLKTYLASEKGKRSGCEYVKFLGGLSDSENYQSQAAIEQAKNNLAKFTIVGFLEELNFLVEAVKQKTGLKLEIPHKRKNPVSNPQLDEEMMGEIIKVCQPDLEVYEYGKFLFIDKYKQN